MLGFNTGLMSDIGQPRRVAASGGGDYTEALTVTLAPVERPGVNAAPSPAWFTVAEVTGCAATGPGAGEARDPKFHDITYVWDFGDAANAMPSNAAALRMPTAWQDINRGYGRRVAHVYSTPGTFTVTVTAYEPATRRKGSASVSVTVGDPKVVFPTTRTIIFNPGNAVNVAPYGYAGANVVTGSWANVLSARNSLGVTPAQILIAPGVILNNTQLCDNPGWGNIRIGGLDPAVRPVISGFVNEGANLIRDNGTSTNIERVVFGLRFVGDWDSTTETGRIVRPFNTFGPAVSTYLAMHHRCEFEGWEVVSGHTGNATAYTFYLVHSELTVTNWQNYGLHGCNAGNTHTAVIACSSYQNPDALSGGAKDTGLYNNHGPLRDFGSLTGYMAACDLFSRNGWSAGGTAPDGLAITSDQPCIRLNTNGTAGVAWNVERVSAEGMINLEEQDSNNTDVPGNYVFDKFVQVMGPRTLQEGIEVRYGGCTFRNGLGVIPNVPSAQTNLPDKWFYLTNEDGAAGNDAGIDIYNCTLLDLRSNANANGVTLVLRADDTGPGDTFLTQTIENNIVHQPNRSPPQEPDAPLDLTTGIGYALRHRGPRVNFLLEAGTLASAVAPGAFFTLSYAEVKTTRYNQSLTDSGSATNQAYWQTNAGTKHKMVMGGATLHAQVANSFEVTFEPSDIRVWNRSAAPWAAGTAWQLMLQRSPALPAWDPAFDLQAVTVPLVRPLAGSPAHASGDAGLRAYDDLLGAVRPGTGNARGALLPG